MPMNIEGPILYYRTDILKKCGVDTPATIKDVEAAAQKIKACDSTITPFVSRGLKPAVAYTFSNMLHNIGGSYMADGKSNLCSPKGKETLDTYSRLLRDYGPPGVVNYSFQQISALYRSGRAAMSFESSNELRTVMEGGERLKDTGLAPFPAGDAGQVPTAIGWGMAVSAYSKQPDAAWYFVQWATSPEIQKRMALQGIAPPRPAVANDPEYRKWIDEQPVRKEWQAALDVLATKGSSEVGYPIVANPEVARVHRPGRAGSDPQAEDRGSGLRGRRQGPRCADCAEVAHGWHDRREAATHHADRPHDIAPNAERRTDSALELAALSAPAVLFTLAMIAFPVVYTVWLGFHAFSSTGRQSFVGLGNYSKLIADHEFWHGLWVTIALYVLSLCCSSFWASGWRCCCFTPSACRASCGRCSSRRS